MKPLFTFILLLLLSFNGKAQLAAPNVTEDEFDPGGGWEGLTHLVTHMNAHSQGNLLINGVPSDLYVFTWDYANEPTYPPEAGIAVRQYPAGVSVDITTTPTFEDFLVQSKGDFPSQTERSSLEAGILREGTNTYIAMSYYQTTWSGGSVVERDIYLDLYEWNAAGGLNLVSSDNLSQHGDLPFGWVHLDVNNLTDLVVTWEQDFRIYTVGGTMSGGLQLSGVGELDEGNINSYELGRPDVAMMQNTGGETTLYYVMTRGDVLFVTEGRFSTLMSIPPGSIDPLPVDLLDHQGIAGEFIYDIPRIDAPDNALYPGHEAWSYVVTENYVNADYVFTGSYSDQNGSLLHAYLNDGSLMPTCGANCNIAPDAAMDPDVYNQRAVVAYSDNGSDRFYAWCLRRPTWAFLPAGAEATYVSVKTDDNLDLLHTVPADEDYFRIPFAPTNTNYSPSVALSTQNDASPELFTAFIQWPDPIVYNYYFGLKTVNWSTTTGFRPENPTAIAEVDGVGTLGVYPNPFTSGFTLDLEGSDAPVKYELKIYNVLGQQIYRDKGTIESINRSLGSIGEKWPAGAYYLELGIRGQETPYRHKVVKW